MPRLVLAIAIGILAGQGGDGRSPWAAAQTDGDVGAEAGAPAAAGHGAPQETWQRTQTPRRQLIVRLPQARDLANGTLLVEPNVEVAETGLPGEPAVGNPEHSALIPGPDGELPAWRDAGDVDLPLPALAARATDNLALDPLATETNRFEYFSPSANAEPMFERAWSHLRRGAWLGNGLSGRACGTGEPGLGHERLPYAPFEIESSQPLNNFRFRVDAVHGFPWPDRDEYFWSKPGRGPAADTGVSYQDFRIFSEAGTDKFSAATDIPIRLLDPDNNANTAGLSDMNLTTKAVLLDGRSWQITQFMRTYLPTGATHKGLGNGHVSLEPGVLARYQWSPETLLHGELRYWLPLGSDPVHSGQILRGGLGFSHVLYETDRFALLHTGEFINYWFLNGRKIVDTATQQTASVDDETSFQYYPGFRLVFDRGCDLGLFEVGLAGTFSTGSHSLYDPLLRLELRWSY